MWFPESPDPKCSYCGTPLSAHLASRCLDAWVHTLVYGRAVEWESRWGTQQEPADKEFLAEYRARDPQSPDFLHPSPAIPAYSCQADQLLRRLQRQGYFTLIQYDPTCTPDEGPFTVILGPPEESPAYTAGVASHPDLEESYCVHGPEHLAICKAAILVHLDIQEASHGPKRD